MEINKCEFCEKYYPSKNGNKVCNACDYDLKYENVCGKALDRMMLAITANRCEKGGSDHVINFN